MEICDITLLGVSICKIIGYPIIGFISLVVVIHMIDNR